MTKLVSPDLVEPVVRGLLGAIDVDGGPTDEQLAILSAVTRHVWDRGDLQLTDLAPFGPAETARIIGDTPAVRRFHYLLFLLEICRHPLTEAQVDRVEAYAAALSLDGMGLEMTRDLIRVGVERARADAARFQADLAVIDAEPAFRDAATRGDFVDPRLFEALDHFATLPEGTLGREFLAFHERFGLDAPGSTHSDSVYLFFSHDMNHVIAGYDPVAEGEMALGAFQMGMAEIVRSAQQRGLVAPDLDCEAYAAYVHSLTLGRTLTDPGFPDTERWLAVALDAAIAPLVRGRPD